MTGKTFADFISKLQEVAVQYRKCRAAALSEKEGARFGD